MYGRKNGDVTDVEADGEGDGKDNEANMEGKDVDDDGHVQLRRTRNPSERIILQKLKNPSFGKKEGVPRLAI